MLRALYTGVTGVNEHQKWIDNIANNVSNVNTDGFKKTRTTFADLISQNYGFALPAEAQTGGVNPKQIGIGVGTATMEVIHTPGSIKATDKETDLAINGDGFFIVNGGRGDLYTRNGNLDFDAQGNFVYSPNGYYVQGWNNPDGEAGSVIPTGGLLEDIKIDLNDIMVPKATGNIVFQGEINKDHIQGIDNFNLQDYEIMVKFKKVLGSENEYEYFTTDLEGNLITSEVKSAEKVENFTLSQTGGNVTINSQIFTLANYSTLDELMADVNQLAGAKMSYEEGIFKIANLDPTKDLKLKEEARPETIGAKIEGKVYDHFEGTGLLTEGNLIGSIDGIVSDVTIDGVSSGLIKGIAGSLRPARISGKTTGEVSGNFSGEGIASGEIAKFEGYLKGDVNPLEGKVDIDGSNNAWIDGEIAGTSIGSLRGNFKAYVKTGTVEGGTAPTAPDMIGYGDFKFTGSAQGYIRADGQVKGFLIGDTDGEVTGRIQGMAGGGAVDTGGNKVTDITTADAEATSKHASAAMISGRLENDFYAVGEIDAVVTDGYVGVWNGSGWSQMGPGGTISGYAIVRGEGGALEGKIKGTAKGDIEGTAKGKVWGGTTNTVDSDNNGLSDAYIEGEISGDFAGWADISGHFFADEFNDYINASVQADGFLEGTATGDLTGTVSGAAYGEINGLIKHADIVAQHFIGSGITTAGSDPTDGSHLNVKMDGEIFGTASAVSSSNQNRKDIVSEIVKNMTAGIGAVINGSVDGSLSLEGENMELIGQASGTIDTGADGGRIEGEIEGEVVSDKANLSGSFKGYLSAVTTFDGEATVKGILRHDAASGGAWFKGVTEEKVIITGPCDLVLDDNTFSLSAGDTKIVDAFKEISFTSKGPGAEIEGKIKGAGFGTVIGQIEAEKKDLPGLFTAANIFSEGIQQMVIKATGGKITAADGEQVSLEMEVRGQQLAVNTKANEDYKIRTKLRVFDSLGQGKDLDVELENIGDSVWLFTTSDGTAGRLFFDPLTGKIANVEYETPGQYRFDFNDLVQFVGPNDLNVTGDGYGKGHLQDVIIQDDGRIVGSYDNDQRRNLAQIALAVFNNPGGLEKVGTTMFKQTANSREPKIETPGAIRSGGLATKTLEMSNVSLTQEFADMILAQQAFTANIRTVTTGDRLLTELMRLRP